MPKIYFALMAGSLVMMTSQAWALNPVPEPASFGLTALGIAGALAIVRHRRRK